MSVIVPDVPPISAEGYQPVSTFGALLINALGPWMTLHLAWVCDGIGVMVDPLWTLVQDHGNDGDPDFLPGYGQLFNVDPLPGQPGYGAPTTLTADLPYVAQFAGVQIPQGSDDTTARSLVMAEAGRNRGTPAAVIAAAKRNLTGTKSVTLIERIYVDGTQNAGWAGLVMRPEECPSLAAVQQAVDLVKLGGVQMWYSLTDAFEWTQAIHTWSADAMTWAETSYQQP